MSKKERRKQLYNVIRAGDPTEKVLFTGNVFEVAEYLGVKAHTVYSFAHDEQDHDGYVVHRVGSWKVQYMATWSGGFTTKIVKGTAPEIARHTGLSTGHIRSLARYGKTSYSGWTIDRITPR